MTKTIQINQLFNLSQLLENFGSAKKVKNFNIKYRRGDDYYYIARVTDIVNAREYKYEFLESEEDEAIINNIKVGDIIEVTHKYLLSRSYVRKTSAYMIITKQVDNDTFEYDIQSTVFKAHKVVLKLSS